jgi:hypothetical protein
VALTPSRTGRGDCITGPFYRRVLLAPAEPPGAQVAGTVRGRREVPAIAHQSREPGTDDKKVLDNKNCR